MMKDENGQPTNYHFNKRILNDRTIDELIGIAKGIVADGAVNKEETVFLLSWMERNARYSNDRIVNLLYSRIQNMLADNILDPSEQEELFQILKSITGEQCPANVVESTVATFPLNIPPPDINIKGSYFCLTGKFAYGPRRICEAAIIERGGNIKSNISDWVDYLVIGSLCSDQWAHTTYGRKIEQAMLLQNPESERCHGDKIAIIHEDHWSKYMFQNRD
jgi:hypothetical protein